MLLGLIGSANADPDRLRTALAAADTYVPGGGEDRALTGWLPIRDDEDDPLARWAHLWGLSRGLTSVSEDTDLADVRERARYAEGLVAPLSAFSSFVGAPVPRTLLVGERRPGSGPWPQRGAFEPRAGNSGEFLLRVMPREHWRTLALVNAFEVGPERLTELVDVLAGPPVVALGVMAAQALETAGIEHAVVPHPQYVRRFHHRRRDEYGTLVVRAGTDGGDHRNWPNRPL